jgi:hypothetical protein
VRRRAGDGSDGRDGDGGNTTGSAAASAARRLSDSVGDAGLDVIVSAAALTTAPPPITDVVAGGAPAPVLVRGGDMAPDDRIVGIRVTEPDGEPPAGAADVGAAGDPRGCRGVPVLGEVTLAPGFDDGAGDAPACVATATVGIRHARYAAVEAATPPATAARTATPNSHAPETALPLPRANETLLSTAGATPSNGSDCALDGDLDRSLASTGSASSSRIDVSGSGVITVMFRTVASAATHTRASSVFAASKRRSPPWPRASIKRTGPL